MIGLGFVFIFTGFFALSLAMKRHYQQIWPHRNQPGRNQIIFLQITGYTCLLVAGIVCMASQGIAVGLVFWTGLLTLAALLQSLLLSYWLQWVKRWL